MRRGSHSRNPNALLVHTMEKNCHIVSGVFTPVSAKQAKQLSLVDIPPMTAPARLAISLVKLNVLLADGSPAARRRWDSCLTPEKGAIEGQRSRARYH